MSNLYEVQIGEGNSKWTTIRIHKIRLVAEIDLLLFKITNIFIMILPNANPKQRIRVTNNEN